MNTKKSTILGLILLAAIVGIFGSVNPVKVHAVENPAILMEAEGDPNGLFVETEDPMEVGLPTASVDEINQWTERKGFELIGLLQKFVQPFAIVIFIGCALTTLLGAFGNGKMVSKGLMGMFISLLMYVVVLYAPEIMDVFLNFIQT